MDTSVDTGFPHYPKVDASMKPFLSLSSVRLRGNNLRTHFADTCTKSIEISADAHKHRSKLW